MATDQGSKVVPGISLAALDAIDDANVRDVLRSLVATHYVRNNQAGSGSESFITTRQALQIAASVVAGSTVGTVAPLPARYVRAPGNGTIYDSPVFAPALATITLELTEARPYAAHIFWQSVAAGGNYNTLVQMQVNGVDVHTMGYSGRAAMVMSFDTKVGLTLPAGSSVVTLHFARDTNVGRFTINACALLLLPLGA